jgi:hypothetical protein
VEYLIWQIVTIVDCEGNSGPPSLLSEYVSRAAWVETVDQWSRRLYGTWCGDGEGGEDCREEVGEEHGFGFEELEVRMVDASSNGDDDWFWSDVLGRRKMQVDGGKSMTRFRVG